MAECRKCHGPLRADNTVVFDPLYLRGDGLCEECYLASLLPPWYKAAEKYLNGNATRKPNTGVPWLDTSTPSLREMAICRKKPK